jgi:membrane-associated phospholipid phosphatase
VTYHVANDFFFSGHTAIAVLAAIEAVQLAPVIPLWIGLIACVIALGEALVVLILRAHYTLDVIAAFFAAFCAAGLANWLADLFTKQM